MVSVPDKVIQMIRHEQILLVGTSNEAICNVSPRTAIHVDKDGSIYWLELFKHKTLRNLKKNPWCTVAVFDKKKLVGYQLKGKAILVSDRKTKSQTSAQIIDRLTRLHKQRILKQSKTKRPNVIKFTAKIVFSLNPNELADSPLIVDANDESLNAADMQW
ncbi:MAG: pyridoxamine 5'-phosphate oxidase family protein [Candidatus Nitrosotenuis sp.]